MRLLHLKLSGVRNLKPADITPGPALNLITGNNGAGKTSVLEALHLMAYGRSFRGRVRDGLVGREAEAVEVFIQWEEGNHAAGEVRQRRAGLRHNGQSWEGRLDGAALPALGDLCAALAVVTFEPGSHALVSGGSEPRRRQLDWGLFHVEPDFLAQWRRYARALKQRNAVLKARQRDQLDSWDHELAEAGEPLARHRESYLEAMEPELQSMVAALLPAAGNTGFVYQPGWRRQELSLADALLLARERDLASGNTSVGPHRGDWHIKYTHLPSRDSLSRGQAKLTALAFLLAQAGHLAALRGDWPIMALDDLASELDREHQVRVLRRLADSGAQVLVTGNEPPWGLRHIRLPVSRFHVEHGLLQPYP